MNTERTPTITDLPVTLADAKVHMRVDHVDEDTVIESLIRTAALEVEEQAGLALLTTNVTVTTDDDISAVIALGIGPVQAGAAATVAVVEDDGGTTALASGFWLEAGRYPRLHITDTTITGPLLITYTAGFTGTPADLPADLQQAITEQALRLYDERGGITDKGPSLSPHAARIIARHRRVSV